MSRCFRLHIPFYAWRVTRREYLALASIAFASVRITHAHLSSPHRRVFDAELRAYRRQSSIGFHGEVTEDMARLRFAGSREPSRVRRSWRDAYSAHCTDGVMKTAR